MLRLRRLNHEAGFWQKKALAKPHTRAVWLYELLLNYLLVFLADFVVFLALVVFVLFFGAAFLVAITDLHLINMNWIKELRNKYNILDHVCQEKNTKYSIFLSRAIPYVVLRICCFHPNGSQK